MIRQSIENIEKFDHILDQLKYRGKDWRKYADYIEHINGGYDNILTEFINKEALLIIPSSNEIVYSVIVADVMLMERHNDAQLLLPKCDGIQLRFLKMMLKYVYAPLSDEREVSEFLMNEYLPNLTMEDQEFLLEYERAMMNSQKKRLTDTLMRHIAK